MAKHTQTFELAIDWILAAEGGYVNDPDDPGGETKYGISKRAHPDIDIANLTEQQAADIYRTNYWLPCRCDGLPFDIALLVFDTAVNSGVRRASIFLQHAVNAKADGVIGPKTIAATKMANGGELFIEYLGNRAVYYHDLTVADSRKAKFLRGWLNRLFRLERFILLNSE